MVITMSIIAYTLMSLKYSLEIAILLSTEYTKRRENKTADCPKSTVSNSIEN
jgi:hypothetical protein